MRAALALLLVGFASIASGCQSWPLDALRPPTGWLRGAVVPTGPLPLGVEPRHYRLRLRVDPDAERVSGAVEIDLELAEATREIWLHGSRLRVRSAVLEAVGGELVRARYREVDASGVAQLRLRQSVPPGAATLRMEFDAPIDTRIDGLYKVSVGAQSYAFTQFEAIRARRAFPCFDEPRFKVPFDLVLEVRREHRAFANTPELERTPLADGFDRVVFATTPPLPTYLVALAVGDFDVVEHAPLPPNAIRQHAVPLRGLAVAGKGGDLAYALEHTAGIVEALEGYVGLAYPYAKLDIVAVPDFAFGAMENAGLITYREILLLLGADAALEQQRAYASVHAHELAHQWFGNLVTMPWWDDIWLNESFATWMGNRAVALWNPAFEFERQTLRGAYDVMSWDVYEASRRIREPVADSEEIANAFDPISYSKGAALIGMLEGWLGARPFQAGIRAYLARHAWGSATAEDWIASMEGVGAGPPGQIARVAQSFLAQPGVPVVRLEWHCDAHGFEIEASQERYRPLGAPRAAEPPPSWVVPMCVRALGEPSDTDGGDDAMSGECTLLDAPRQRWRGAGASCPVALVPNRDGQGYYRWSFARARWESLFADFAALTAGEQYAAASNLEAELRAGRIDVAFYLEALGAVAASPHWDVVSQPIDAITWIADALADPPERAALAAEVMRIYEPVLVLLEAPAARSAPATGAASRAVGLAAAPPVQRRLVRERLLDLAAVELGDPLRREQMARLGERALGLERESGVADSGAAPEGPEPSGTRRLAQAAASQPRAAGSAAGTGTADDSGALAIETVEPDLLGVALASAVEARGEAFFRALRRHFVASSDPAFRSKALQALARTQDPRQRDALLAPAFLSELRTQEWPMLFAGLQSRSANRRPFFEWYRRNVRMIRRSLPESYLARAPGLMARACSVEDREAVAAFFAPMLGEVPGLSRTLSRTLEGIDHCVAAREALRPLGLPAPAPAPVAHSQSAPRIRNNGS